MCELFHSNSVHFGNINIVNLQLGGMEGQTYLFQFPSVRGSGPLLVVMACSLLGLCLQLVIAFGPLDLGTCGRSEDVNGFVLESEK